MTEIEHNYKNYDWKYKYGSMILMRYDANLNINTAGISYTITIVNDLKVKVKGDTSRK